MNPFNFDVKKLSFAFRNHNSNKQLFDSIYIVLPVYIFYACCFSFMTHNDV